MHIADRGLYAAKHAGKNRWVGIHAAAAVDPPTLRKRIDDDLHRLAREGILCLRQARGESWPEDVPCESASSAVA